MQAASARAPGKLMLTGDYAVLAGAPALAAAVDRYVSVTIEPSNAWQLHGLGHFEDRLQWQHHDAFVEWCHRASDQWQLVAGALATWLGDPVTGFTLRIDSRQLNAAGIKLGLGSSAAVLVALARALYAASLTADIDLTSLMAVQHRVQGPGSGCDLAASYTGGLIRYQRRRRDQQPSITPAARLDIDWLPVWTGQPTSTAGVLQRLDEQRIAGIDDLCQLSELAATTSQAQTFLGVIDDIRRALERFGQHHGIDIVSPVQRKIASIAADHGYVAKPSGAGGGDFGLIFGSRGSVTQDDDLQRALRSAGLTPMTLQIAPPTAATLRCPGKR